jgi:hypothetical protein
MNDLDSCRLMVLSLDGRTVNSVQYQSINQKFRKYWSRIDSPQMKWGLSEEGLKVAQDIKSSIPFIDFERIKNEL